MTEFNNLVIESEFNDKLEIWLKSNIFSPADNLVRELEMGDYEYLENEDEVIFNWYIITDEAYEKFKKMGWVVAKIGELNLFGRTIYGQPLINDFYRDPNFIKIILET